jgi:uncharacterized protein (DUF4415 family)
MKEKIVSYRAEDIPPISAERLAEMEARFNDPNFEIDTSDIPEWTEEDFKNAVRGKFYRPVKQQVTAKLDSDVVAWLKKDGRGYQTRLNAILRQAMLADAKDRAA